MLKLARLINEVGIDNIKLAIRDSEITVCGSGYDNVIFNEDGTHHYRFLEPHEKFRSNLDSMIYFGKINIKEEEILILEKFFRNYERLNSYRRELYYPKFEADYKKINEDIEFLIKEYNNYIKYKVKSARK